MRPQSVDNVGVNHEDVGARRRLAPTGSTLQVKPDAAFGGLGHVPLPVSPAVTDGSGTRSLTRNDKMTTRRILQQPAQERPALGLHFSLDKPAGL